MTTDEITTKEKPVPCTSNEFYSRQYTRHERKLLDGWKYSVKSKVYTKGNKLEKRSQESLDEEANLRRMGYVC